jgi:hypothetical protein
MSPGDQTIKDTVYIDFVRPKNTKSKIKYADAILGKRHLTSPTLKSNFTNVL